MLKAVLDSTVLVSAFLKPVASGASFEVLSRATGGYELWLSKPILDETERVLLTAKRLRQRYHYPDSAVCDYRRNLKNLAKLARRLPIVHVVRDPADDMIVATALAAKADCIVTRDLDLLSLKKHRKITMVSPEDFLADLRHNQ